MSEHTGWEVKSWCELEREGDGAPERPGGTRLFALEVRGPELPVKGERLIPAVNRGEDEDDPLGAGKISDFCRCGHTRGSHFANAPVGGRIKSYADCGVKGCSCGRFELLAAGVEGVEEMPPDPGQPEGLSPQEAIEGAAITFWRAMEREAGLDQADPETWMALQRLIDKGWRFLPPPEES